MSTREQPPFSELCPDDFPDINWDDHLKFCGNGELHDDFFSMDLHLSGQTDLVPSADGPDFSLLHDASPTSPSVHLQTCFNAPTAARPSALTQGLREWGNSTASSTVVSPTIDLLSDDLINSCNVDSEPFNPLFLTESGNTTPINASSSEYSSFNSSVGSIPIPHQTSTFSEHSFCSEPSLGYTGSSFSSDRSFDTLYAAHKRNELLAPPQQNVLAIHSQPQASSSQPQSQPQKSRSVYVQRTRHSTADYPKRFAPTSVGSGVTKNTLSFIHCRPSEDAGRLLIYGAEHSPNAKRPRGRKNPLTPAQKQHAALMRRVKACDNCRQRKEKCDPGIPCKACIEHFRTDLVRQPCRGKFLEDLTSSMLSDQLGWCPMERTLDMYFGPGAYTISSEVSFVNLILGFGPPLLRQVRRVIAHPSQLIHSHIVYDWPPHSGETKLRSHPRQDHHYVFPAILADTSDLRDELDDHLTRLVNDDLSFRQFPLFNSPLEILKHVYIFYRELGDATHRHLLLTALKFLVLVHIGDHTELDVSAPLFYTFLGDPNCAQSMTPCFIRGQLGAVIPSLAQELLREALSGLESICLARRCTDWPPVLAALATLCMAIESIQYHAAKEPYHARFKESSPFSNSSSTAALSNPDSINPEVLFFGPERPPSFSTLDGTSMASPNAKVCQDGASPVSTDHEKSVNNLIHFYRTCYRGCHCSRLQDWDPTSSSAPASSRWARQQRADDDAVSARFINGLKASLKNAGTYLAHKRSAGMSVMKIMSSMGRKMDNRRKGDDTGTGEGVTDNSGTELEEQNPVDMSIFFDRLLAKLFLG